MRTLVSGLIIVFLATLWALCWTVLFYVAFGDEFSKGWPYITLLIICVTGGSFIGPAVHRARN